MESRFTKDHTLMVKGVAIVGMLFYHLFEHYERVTAMEVNFAPFTMDTFLLLSGFGNICVAVFAFLSAYGIALGLENLDIKGELLLSQMYRQATKRWIKLGIHFMIMFLSVNALWFYKFSYSQLYGRGIHGFLYAILDMTGLAEFFETPTLNGTWWYMELAVIIIFLVPLLYLGVKKLGGFSLILGLVLPVIIPIQPDFKRYYFVILLGVVAANKQWVERLLLWQSKSLLRGVLGLLAGVAAMLLRQNYVVYHEFGYLVDGVVVLVCIWVTAGLLAQIPGIRWVLKFLGKHSMNIYFVHTFFYMAIYQEFIYSFHYAGLILLVLTGVCLLYSVILEGLKKIIGIPLILKHIDHIFEDRK